jgi:hypothetical protein
MQRAGVSPESDLMIQAVDLVPRMPQVLSDCGTSMPTMAYITLTS